MYDLGVYFGDCFEVVLWGVKNNFFDDITEAPIQDVYNKGSQNSR